MRTFLRIYFVAVLAIGIFGHDVVWPENPFGFNPGMPMVLQQSESKIVQIKPITGELCSVTVVMTEATNALAIFQLITDNPAREVEVLVTPTRAPVNGKETIVLQGYWTATGFDEDGSVDPDCTAVFPNFFSVPVQVTTNRGGFFLDPISTWSGRPGQALMFSGMGLSQVKEVRFGGMSGQFTIMGDGSLRVIAPNDAPIGPITFVTPDAQIQTAHPFVIQPQLQLAVLPNGRLMISWGERRYPFTLQWSRSIGGEAWNDVITTFDSSVTLSPQTTGFYRLMWNEIPLDLTDYNRDRPSVAWFYHQDPVGYWAQFGVPAISRLAMMRQQVLLDPLPAFSGFLEGFDQDRFLTALEAKRLPESFTKVVTNLLSGNSVSNAFAKSFMSMVASDDASTNCMSFSGFRTNCMSTNVSVFASVITNSMSATRWTNSAPFTNKVFFDPYQTNFGPVIKWVDVHGSDAFTTNRIPVVPPNDDNNTNFVTKWTDITSPDLWNTTYDGACVAVAVGASLAKLGVVGATTTCQFWNDLSRNLGATPGTLGAYEDDIAAFYKGLGYGCEQAYDGPRESAVQEAKKALDRGCDVQIEYISSDNTHAHEEVILDITIDPNDSSNATISTLSWGQSATVTYKGSVFGGGYSGKSDGQRYRKSTETSSYLERSGTAIVRYYCKE